MKNEHKLVYLEDRIRFLEAEIEQLTKENLVLQEKHEIQETVFNKSLVGYYIFVGGVFRMINPVNHGSTDRDAAIYKVEPYVVAADVYAEGEKAEEPAHACRTDHGNDDAANRANSA